MSNLVGHSGLPGQSGDTPGSGRATLSLHRWAQSWQDFPRAHPACGRLEPEARCLRPHQGHLGLRGPRRMLVASCLLQPAGRPSQQGRPLGPIRSQNRGQLEAQSRAGLPETLLSGAWTSCLMPLLRTVLLPAAPSREAVALGLLSFDQVTDLGGGPGRLPRAPLW